jgi:pentatricopeptide repeat protein
MLQHSAGKPVPLQVYGALAKAFARSGDLRRALEVLELMQADGVAPNEQVMWGNKGLCVP